MSEPARRAWAGPRVWGLVRLGLAVATALFCMLLVFGIGWTAATLW